MTIPTPSPARPSASVPRTENLGAAPDLEELERFRLAALNMMEDAAEARRRLEQANQDLARAVAANSRLVAAIQQGWDAVVITDTDANIEYVNSTFERVTGY